MPRYLSYNPKTMNFEAGPAKRSLAMTGFPPPPPPDFDDDPMVTTPVEDPQPPAGSIPEPDNFEDFYAGLNNQYGMGGKSSKTGSLFGSLFGGLGGGDSGGIVGQIKSSLFGGDNSFKSDDLVPGAELLSKTQAPPGYAYAIDPLTGEPELVDLSPLDPSQPAAGWKYILSDPADASSGEWKFLPGPDVLDKPFQGVPDAVIGWLQVALDNGGDVSQVPEGPARSWVQYLLTQATNPGRRPDDVPFGTGLPNFNRNTPGFPTAPGHEGGFTSAMKSELEKLTSLYESGAKPQELLAQINRLRAQVEATPSLEDDRALQAAIQELERRRAEQGMGQQQSSPLSNIWSQLFGGN